MFGLIGTNEVQELTALLNKHGSKLDVITMKDARDFTVLSYACYKNSEECFMLLYNHALDKNLTVDHTLKYQEKRQILSKWANTPTDEEFTALHFATYHGNFQLIKFLIENADANIHQRNKFGSTVMHVASQGDQALPLYYFKTLTVDINVKDNRGSTPLHWACYSRSELALNYLLSMNPDIEAKDE